MRRIKKTALRIIDANLNRLQEGLRVCEEVARFIFNCKTCTQELKSLRHKIVSTLKVSGLNFSSLIEARNAKSDVGKDLDMPHLKKEKVKDVFLANAQRVKESLRVLEEFSKLFNEDLSIQFKDIRFKFYSIEKNIVKRFQTLSYLR